MFIRATPEQVWDAITKPEFTAQYFYGSVIDSTYEPGAPYTRLGRGPLAAVRRRRGDRGRPAAEARHDVARDVRPRDRGGAAQPRHVGDRARGRGRHEAHRVHDELEAAPKTAANVAGGWSYVLSGLKTLLETGEPLGLA